MVNDRVEGDLPFEILPTEFLPAVNFPYRNFTLRNFPRNLDWKSPRRNFPRNFDWKSPRNIFPRNFDWKSPRRNFPSWSLRKIKKKGKKYKIDLPAVGRAGSGLCDACYKANSEKKPKFRF